MPADALRFTIEFADGRSVTNLDPAPGDPEVSAFQQPMLSSGPGTGLVGSGASPDRRGIPPSRVEIDSAAVLGAAEAAVRLWADDPYCSAD